MYNIPHKCQNYKNKQNIFNKKKGHLMKKSRKLMSILLVVAMLFTLAAPAMAANEKPHTITITNETAGHTYTAYQVFSGDIEILDGKEVLTNIAWGNGVNGNSLLTK